MRISVLRRVVQKVFTAAAIFALVSCGGHSANSVTPPVARSTVQQPAQNANARSNIVTVTSTISAAACSTPSVKSLQVTPTTLTIAAGTSGQFTACTQSFSPYTITALPTGLVTFPATVNPTEAPGGTIYKAIITVTAGQTTGTTTLTIKDRKGNFTHVTVTVVPGVGLSCPSAAVTGATGVSCTYTNGNASYSGGYTASTSVNGAASATCSVSPSSPTTGSFTASDSAAENCKITITESSAPGLSASKTIQFVGALTISCPDMANLGATGVSCMFGSQNYSGAYNAPSASATSNNCGAGAASNGSFTVTDTNTAGEDCNVTVTQSAAPNLSVQTTIHFVGPLTVSCTTPASISSGTSCAYHNPNYSAGYSAPSASSISNKCSAGAASNGTFTVTDSNSVGEDCTVTLTPSSGPEQGVSAKVTFVGPLTLSCSSPISFGPTGVACTYTDTGYSGFGTDSYTASASSTSTNCAVGTPSGGSVTVNDSTSEPCTVTLTESLAPQASTQATIQFIGPLILTCPNAGTTTASAKCTYTNTNYDPSAYTTSAASLSNNCSASSVSSSSFTVSDGTAEGCTVTLTPSSGNQSAVSAQITFSADAGVIALSCPAGASDGTSGAGVGGACTYTNSDASYAGSYTISLTAGSGETACSDGSVSLGATSGSFTVFGSGTGTCTVTLTPDSGTESAASATITYGGAGLGCSPVRRGGPKTTTGTAKKPRGYLNGCTH